MSQNSPTNSSQPNSNSTFTLSGFEGQLVSAVDHSQPDSGDYIPCEFTLDQLLSLRPKPEVLLFGSYEQEKLRATVIAEALAQKTTKEFPDAAKLIFIESINRAQFIGLTPSQALALVIVSLDEAIQDAPFKEASLKAQHTELLESITSKKGVSDEESLSGQQGASGKQSTMGQTTIPGQTTPGQTTTPGQQGATAQAGASSYAGAQAEKIVGSARAQISAFQRPPDIGCAMSIMDWNEIRYAFGQTVANEYIGVQIVVRNVNPNKEFLIHDAEISVDADLNGRYGRFYSGQDKLTVRQYMLSSRDYGRRNFIVHLAQGVGSVMSAASLVYGPGLQAATNVFNAGFITALQTVWTDHNTEQLNLLNDVGFSASKTDRTVVPKSGTAMFVIFIPSKQFENGWWVQPCASNIILKPAGSPATSRFATPGIVPTVGGGSLQSGIDLDSLRAVCIDINANNVPTKNSAAGPVTSANSASPQLLYQTSDPEANTNTLKYMKPKQVRYEKWSPMANAIFNELTLAVVAGTHFTEDTDNNPVITTITCPVDQLGNLDYTKANAGVLTCDATGTSLDKAKTVKLRNAQNAADTKTADGTVNTSGDSTKAAVKLELAQLGALEAPTYKVWTVSSAGTESGGAPIIHLNAEPFVSDDPSRSELNLDELLATNAKAATVTLKGYHLDKLKSVHLGSQEDKVTSSDPISIDANMAGSPTATSASFEVTPAQAAKLPPGTYSKGKELKLYIFTVSSDKPGSNTPTDQTLLATGTVKAKADQPKPTPAPTKKNTPAAGGTSGKKKAGTTG